MNILYIAPCYPKNEDPYSAYFLHKQAKALIEFGVSVTVVDIDFRSLRHNRRWGVYRDDYDGVEVYRVSIPLGTKKIIPSSMIARLAQMCGVYVYKKFFIGRKFDLIHAQFAFESGNAGVAIKKKYKIPLVVTEHSSAIMQKSRHLDAMNDVYSLADQIISVSEYLKKMIFEKFNRESIVISNVLDEDKFSVLNVKKNEKFTFLTVSRLIEWKCIDKIIMACKSLVEKEYDFKLVIIGNGDQIDNLKNLVVDNNLTEYVCFLGNIVNDKLPVYYNQSHCFVLPSKGETFGMVFAESIACGVPVIATKCGAPESFINNDNGIVIEENDVAHLSEAMIMIYEHISDYDSKYMSKEIVKNFGKNSICRQIVDVYNSIGKRK